MRRLENPKNAILNKAVQGIVRLHVKRIFPTTRLLKPARPHLAKPAPIIDPTLEWVVEIGIPNPMRYFGITVKAKIVRALEYSAASPVIGSMRVTLKAAVLITRYPQVKPPIAMKTAPNAESMNIVSSGGVPTILPVAVTKTPVAFAISLPPNAKAEKARATMRRLPMVPSIPFRYL